MAEISPNISTVLSYEKTELLRAGWKNQQKTSFQWGESNNLKKAPPAPQSAVYGLERRQDDYTSCWRQSCTSGWWPSCTACASPRLGLAPHTRLLGVAVAREVSLPSLLTRSVQQTFGLGAPGRVSLLGSPFQWFVCFSFPAFPLPALASVQRLAVTYLPNSCSLSLGPPRSCRACRWRSLNFSFVSLGMQHIDGGSAVKPITRAVSVCLIYRSKELTAFRCSLCMCVANLSRGTASKCWHGRRLFPDTRIF